MTESVLMDDAATTVKVLQSLKDIGVRLSIDDFGTGYSSLSYLVQLPVDILKIDRAFTAPARDAGPEDWAFTRAILDLASSLHLVAIAEGVETPAQARALQVLDCPLAQGFLYSPPVPAAAIEPMLAAWNPLLQPESGAEPAPAPVG